MFKCPTTRNLFASFASGVNAPLGEYCRLVQSQTEGHLHAAGEICMH